MLKYTKSFLAENKYIILLFSIILMGRLFLFPTYEIDGASMDYTLAHGQKAVGINYFDIERFDIVIIDVPELNKYYVKRIIGMPGDKVEYKNDMLYINDQFIEEPYLDAKKSEWTIFTTDFLIDKVPDNEYFVLGDNRRNSKDSRSMGTISKGNILSKLFSIYYPLDEMKIVN